MTAPLPLAGTTFAWLHDQPLDESIAHLRDAGFQIFELMTVMPHVGATQDPGERRRVRAIVERGGLPVLSVNPTFLDINLVSPDPVIRGVSVDRMTAEIEMAADLGAPFAIVMPGRRHALSPASHGRCMEWLRPGMERLLSAAEHHNVTLCIENSPYGYIGRSQDIQELVREYDSPWLRVVYDVANALAVEDPREGVKRLGELIALAHVSDTWRDRWAHTSPGRGEVDFAAFADALDEIGFTGFTVYELVDGEPVGERLDPDVAALVRAGWSLSGRSRE